MKGKILFLTMIFSFSFLLHPFAQWPGNFYAFILKDSTGKIIRATDTKYKMITMPDSITGVITEIKICNDDSIWRFYEGGNHYMGSTQKLKIVETAEGKTPESMIIEFPPSFSKGKEQYYRNLYAGVLKFKNGTVIIRLPKTGIQWDSLKELKLCEDGINFTSYYDVSKFQK